MKLAILFWNKVLEQIYVPECVTRKERYPSAFHSPDLNCADEWNSLLFN